MNYSNLALSSVIILPKDSVNCLHYFQNLYSLELEEPNTSVLLGKQGGGHRSKLHFLLIPNNTFVYLSKKEYQFRDGAQE